MADPAVLLGLLGRQTLVLSLACVLLLMLRPLLLRRFGAAVAYAAWLLLPLLVLVASLPGSAPARSFGAAVWVVEAAAASGVPAALPALHAAAWSAALAGVWALGVIAGLLRMAALQRRYARSLRCSADGSHYWAPAGHGPALLGVLRPRLVLPLDFEQRFDACQQVLVRCHEQVHGERHDNAWNLLAALLCLLHWFNPLAWLAWHRMRADQELACDAAVMARHPGRQRAHAYGLALLQAQGTALPQGLPWSHWQSIHPLTERIAMLTRHTIARTTRRTGGLVLLLLGLASAGAVHAWRATAEAPEATPSAADVYVEVAMDLNLLVVGDGTLQHGSKRTSVRPKMRMAAGSEGMLILGGAPDQATPEQLQIKVRALPLAGQRWQLDFALAHGLPLQVLAEPRLVVVEGEVGRIELNHPARGHLTLAVTARRVGGSS